MKKVVRIIALIAVMFLFAACAKKKVNNDEPKINTDGLESVILSIQKIEDEFFLAAPPWASPDQYKVFATFDKDLCVGDYVEVYYDERVEVDKRFYEITAKLVEPSDFELEPGVDYKPVIYLYPTEETKVFVSLDYKGRLTHTAPLYSDGWNVTAYPDGRLIDDKGEEYPYLFWEGESDIEYDLSKGFCVPGHQTEQFLRTKLAFMGLNAKELEDFIDFWLPFMEKNSYNKICFQTRAYTENAKLTVYPEPDSMLRIFMVFQPLNEFVDIEEQALNEFERRGFSLVEWGGSFIK